MERKTDVGEYNAAQLERMLFFYPWYSYARVKMMEKLAEADVESAEQKLRESAAYYPDLGRFFAVFAECSVKESENVIDFEAISSVAKEADQTKYVIVGADYFSPEDLRSAEEELDNVRMEPVKVVEDAGEVPSAADSDISDFYTETLARIYAGQGYYDEAIKVYAKLILLYPEKSAYFAALADEIKSKKS